MKGKELVAGFHWVRTCHARFDSYVSELFALNNNLLINWNYIPKWIHIQRIFWGNLTKDDFIGIALNLQSKMESSNTKVLEELRLLNEKFDKLEAGVSTARNANSLFSSHLVKTERQCWENTQEVKPLKS